MKQFKRTFFIVALATLGISQSCGETTVKDLLFPVTDDVALGQQVVDQIEGNPDEFLLLDETEYPETYSYLNAMKNSILQSDMVEHEDIFAYDLTIIHNDTILNAFATPGGYIYVYTGLIKYLDNADDLAGVMGHEIAHADRRHSVNQMIKNIGVQTLISVVSGDSESSTLAEVVSGLLSLKFSRTDEAEADEYSVIYLGDTDYACNGAATFFEKIEAEGGVGVPEFLSTHPDPSNRVADINAKATEEMCDTTPITETGMTYEDFKNSLPQ